MKIDWEKLWNERFWPKNNFLNNWPKSEDHIAGDGRKWNLWIYGSWECGGEVLVHPALWQPQISSQKRLNLYSIFFHQGCFVHQTCGKGERKTIRIWKVLCKRLQTEKFRRITRLHFATQSDSNFMLWQNVYLWNSQLSLKFLPTKFEVMSKI